MNNIYNASNAIIRSREVQLLVVVVDSVSLLADRVSGHLCCAFLLSYSHPPPTHAPEVMTDRICRKDGDSFFLNPSYHTSVLAIFHYLFTEITWSDGSADGGNIVGSGTT